MAEKIICWIVSLICAIMFYSIGAYAKKSEKPMGFWSGVEVKESEISDVKKYNKENSIMWKLYSLWYVAAAVAEIWSTVAYLVVLCSSFTVGLILLICTYQKIYKKYKAE